MKKSSSQAVVNVHDSQQTKVYVISKEKPFFLETFGQPLRKPLSGHNEEFNQESFVNVFLIKNPLSHRHEKNLWGIISFVSAN